MALTDTAVRQAKPSGKNDALKDSGGLALFVGPRGAKQWHFRFYWLGKQARISFGAVRLTRNNRPNSQSHIGFRCISTSPLLL